MVRKHKQKNLNHEWTWLLLCGGVVLLWNPPTLFALQDQADEPTIDDGLEDIDLLDIDVPMVVTATRRAQALNTVPYAVSVITAQDIRNAGARSVPQALRLVPGMDVAELSYGNAAVSPRGFHGFLSRQVLVLVDGRQIYDSHFGGTLWGSWPFQLEDIERIEVIRGPGGVTWGANAVNGVINIITKDPSDQLGWTLSATAGSRGSHREYIGYAFEDGPLRLRVSGEYEGSDGFTEGGSLLRRLDDRYRAGRAGLHAVYAATDHDTMTLSAGHASVFDAYPPTPIAGFGLTRRAESQASYVLGKWRHTIDDDSHIELTTYVNDFFASPGVPAIDYRYQQAALQLSHTFSIGQAHTLTWGIDTRLDFIDGTNSDPFQFSKDHIRTGSIGIYIQDDWAFAPRWTLNMGARLDYEFYGGFEPSARAALSYALDDNTTVYGAISRAFQMTPAGLRFLDLPLLNGIAQAVGHRDVDAEVLMAYELGLRTTLFDRMHTQLNWFWHEFDDLTTISPMLGPPGLIRVDFDNRANASMVGVELDLRYELSSDLTLFGHYTFQEINWRSTAPLHDKDMMRPPRHKCMIGATYRLIDHLSLSGYLYYVGQTQAPNPEFPFVSKDVPDYFRLDLRAEYEIPEQRAAVAVGVRNLLDDHHKEGGTLFLNDAEVPRMVYAEVRINLP